MFLFTCRNNMYHCRPNSKEPVKVYIGIDDTDSIDTRGTGYQARMLGISLMKAGLWELHAVTRHQLLVDRRIPYTSHNSSACLVGEAFSAIDELIGYCKDFLIRESACDSDAGLCVAEEEKLCDEITEFGLSAKKEIITKEEARSLARKKGIFLDGFLNKRIGMIGALAAVGLMAQGNDGRLLWTKNLRESSGIFTVSEYQWLTGIQTIVDSEGQPLPDFAAVHILEWTRPVMRNGLITLIVEKYETGRNLDYISASKEFIKSISE